MSIRGFEDDYTGSEFVELIRSYNSNLHGQIEVHKLEGDTLIFEVDDEMAASLSALNWEVETGSGQRIIHYSGKKALRERVEIEELSGSAKRVTFSAADEKDVMELLSSPKRTGGAEGVGKVTGVPNSRADQKDAPSDGGDEY